MQAIQNRTILLHIVQQKFIKNNETATASKYLSQNTCIAHEVDKMNQNT